MFTQPGWVLPCSFTHGADESTASEAKLTSELLLSLHCGRRENESRVIGVVGGKALSGGSWKWRVTSNDEDAGDMISRLELYSFRARGAFTERLASIFSR